MTQINDRIDLKTIGTWANALRPNGLVLEFAGYPGGDAFLMNTVQLVDVNNKAIFSVHNVASREVIAFTRPTTAPKRLIMYRNGIGVQADTFACSSIVFRTNITTAMITQFNNLHPADVNPIIIDNGTAMNPNLIIPTV